MTTPYFDTLYYDHIEGKIAEPVVKDFDGTPNRVLELDKNWQVEINWSLTSNAPASHPVDLLEGTWEVKVSVESIGIGDEKDVASVSLPLSTFSVSSAAQRIWNHIFTILAGKITQEAVYLLVTLITYRDTAGHRRAMAGFTEGPMITFYRD